MPDQSDQRARAGDEDGDAFLSLAHLKRQFESYLSTKNPEIEEAREARRYYNHVQWTAEEIEIFRCRNQPVVTFPRVGRKIDGIVGIAEQTRQDPKAYPRTPDDEEGADLATAVVRYLTERNEWASKKPNCLRRACVDGIAGVELRLIEGDKGDPDIEIDEVQVDDFFYDPHSINPGFTDSRFEGLSKYLDVDEAVELFPDQEQTLRSLADAGSSSQIQSDRKIHWIQDSDRRILLVEHWYKHRGEWCWAFYCGWSVLAQGVSPFKNERGKTIPRFFMFSAFVDQDGDRYGLVRALKGMQDEINHRRSKALFQANSRRLIMQKGAVDDVERARREWARPDGVVEVNGSLEIKPDDSTPDITAQFQFLTDAKNEFEAYANINPAALAGGAVNLSGRAVNLLQKPGIAELGPLLIGYRNWTLRVYRALWNVAQTYWTAERWIRVTDDRQLAQYLQINGLEVDEFGRPSIVNAIGALDVDIVLDEGPDVENMMQDAFDVAKGLPPGAVPQDILIELMPLPHAIKEQWRQKMNQPPDPMRVAAAQLALKQASAEVDETTAATGLKKAQAVSALASAAHKAGEAHLNAANVFDGGAAAMNGPDAAPTPGQPPSPGPLGPMPSAPAAPLPPGPMHSAF